MKLKQSTVCHTCRAHKIGCDGKLPTCSQCFLTGRRCGGYKLDPVFIPYTATRVPRASRKNRATNSSAAVPSNVGLIALNVGCAIPGSSAREPPTWQIPRPIDIASSEEYAAVVLSCFVPKYQQNPPSFDISTSQVCGAWVGILPSLVARASSGELITSATKAFATSILDRSAQAKSKSFQSLEAYNTTVQRLNKELLSAKGFFSVQTAASIVCLAMVELMLPISDNGHLAHCGGLGALINSFSPGLFACSELHAIFVGCRPVLLFQALTTRKATFLGQNKWLTSPFKHHPPSEIQALIGDAAILPSIMETIDILPTLPRTTAVAQAQEMETKLGETFGHLSKWSERFERDMNGSPGPPRQIEVLECRKHSITHFWFPSLVAANVHTHMWAFQIICLLERGKLVPYLPDGDAGRDESRIFDNLSSFASNICQCMEYLLQDDLQLFGPASAVFPLNIAYEVLNKDKELHKQQIERCCVVFDQIRGRGISSKALFPAAYRETRFSNDLHKH
ncbi:hypothetical protein T440DRAFT_501575, partial [Plenodomus tracheiphilus IPT5]